MSAWTMASMQGSAQRGTRDVVCVFRRPVFYTDMIASLRVGPLVHVELLPMDRDSPLDTLSYTSYVGCPFSMSISTKRTFDDSTCVALALRVTTPEMQALVSYLHDLCVAKIPYNYSDAACLALPAGVRETLLADLPSSAPCDVTSLFCSQAVVLALRHALAPGGALAADLALANSRTVSPYALFHLLRPFAHPVSCAALARGELEPRALREPV